MEREPREAGLIALETGAVKVVGPDWHRRMDKVFIENLGKYRKYDGASVQDLLRALRNKVSQACSIFCIFQRINSHSRKITTRIFPIMSNGTWDHYPTDSLDILHADSLNCSCMSILSSHGLPYIPNPCSGAILNSPNHEFIDTN